MPYPGASSDDTKKIDRCVKKVMAENPSWSKSRAIATCRKAIEKKSEGVMPKTKNGVTARQRRKADRRQQANHPEAHTLADDPQADIRAEEEEYYSFEDYVDENPDEILEDEEALLDGPTEPDSIEDFIDEVADEVVERLGDDFIERLTSHVYDTPEDAKSWQPSEKELDLVEAEMWASFTGNIGLDTKFNVIKAKLSTATRNNLPDSAFACIREGGKKDESGKTIPRSLRRLPIHDKAHVRNALARLPQMMKRGGESATIARCGRAKVMSAAKKMGIGKAGKESLNGIIVEKDATETYRWIGWVSNNFKDRDGEIIKESAHKEYIAYLDANPGHAPEFWSWHTKGTARESKVDAWLYHKGFLIMSGPLTDTEAYRLMKAISSDDVGMSHGFFCIKDPSDPSVITKYRTYEVSDLPLKRAANVWTNIETHLKEVTSMSNEQVEYLKTLVGEDYVEALLEKAEENSEILTELGIESKEIDDAPEQEDEKLTKKQEKVVEEVFEQEYSEIKQFMDTAGKLMPLMAQEIVDLKKQLAKTEEEQEDKLAEMLESSLGKRLKAVEKRASANEDNVTEDETDGPSWNPDELESWFGIPLPKREEA